MDEDIFTDLSVLNAKKTYMKKTSKGIQPLLLSENKKKAGNEDRPRPLTTKVAVKFLLEGNLKTKVCRYCLNVTPGLSELDQIMNVGGPGTIYKVSIRDIVACFHPFKVIEDPNFPNKICQKCLDKALNAYLFTQQCERAERAMLNCFEDIYEKFEKLDPIDRPKKRGRQKLNPNYNILHAEHHQVIDYAEPIINIVNIGAESVTNEPELNEFECKKCWQVLPNLESLMNHETLHPKTMWYHCRLCGKSFPKLNQLKKHNNRVHVLGKELVPFNEKEFKCKECDYVTESFIQHLQHIEKHKFKNIMEHLLKKKMDKLCAICFNKGTKMTDLENMVCIHGCHPDLMGDKTLYTLLASTLPDTKSYKYKELSIPSMAQIMTISKRSNSCEKQYGKKIIKQTSHSQFKDFTFSYPIIVSKSSFKTNHFFFYVFSDPEYQKDDSTTYLGTIDMDITETIETYTPRTKLVEIVDITEVKVDKNTKSVNFETDKNNKKIINEDRNPNNEPNIVNNELYTNSERVHKPEEEEANILEYTFTSPNLVNEVDKKFNYKRKATNISKMLPKSNFEHIKSGDFEIKQRSAIKSGDNKEQRKDLYDTQWVFKNCTYIDFRFHVSEEDECKFCWVFNDVGTCYYCKKAIKNNHTENNSIAKTPNKYSRDKDIRNFDAIERDNTWQCGICLTNNNLDRLTCHCCGTMQVTENRTTVKMFGNKTFFQTNKMEENETFREETDNGDTNNLNKVISVEDLTMMDCKSIPEDIIEPDKCDINNMDIEMSTAVNVITPKNDSEAMDIEDNPISNLDWNATFKFNINTATIPVNNFPMDETTFQFSIGQARGQKLPLKKPKRVIRNLPRSHHK